MGQIRLKLIDSPIQIQRNINRVLADHVNQMVIKGKGKLLSRVKPLIANWILEQPEVGSLLDGSSGSLASQVGIPQGHNQSVVDHLVSSIVASTNIKIQPFDAKLTRGRLDLNFQPSDFSNLLEAGFFEVLTKKGIKLEWLRWLLQEGSKPIIIGYEYVPSSGKGRSNSGTMRAGVAWRIQPSFAGTPENNFITRAFSRREKDIEKLFAQVIGGV
jgi:hypothetical protein